MNARWLLALVFPLTLGGAFRAAGALARKAQGGTAQPAAAPHRPAASSLVGAILRDGDGPTPRATVMLVA